MEHALDEGAPELRAVDRHGDVYLRPHGARANALSSRQSRSGPQAMTSYLGPGALSHCTFQPASRAAILMYKSAAVQ